MGAPKPKAKAKASLKSKVEAEIGNRDIEEVIKEAREEVARLEATVATAQKEEAEFNVTVEEAKGAMELASASVDASVQKETIALEKFKAAREALIAISKQVAD